jgi:hypothetical protein
MHGAGLVWASQSSTKHSCSHNPFHAKSLSYHEDRPPALDFITLFCSDSRSILSPRAAPPPFLRCLPDDRFFPLFFPPFLSLPLFLSLSLLGPQMQIRHYARSGWPVERLDRLAAYADITISSLNAPGALFAPTCVPISAVLIRSYRLRSDGDLDGSAWQLPFAPSWSVHRCVGTSHSRENTTPTWPAAALAVVVVVVFPVRR